MADYYERGGTRWLRFQEKRGREHELPVHSKAREAIDLWSEACGLCSNAEAPLFPAFAKDRDKIELQALESQEHPQIGRETGRCDRYPKEGLLP